MKNFKNIMLVTLSVISLSACDSLLDRAPLDVISDEQVYKDQALADRKLDLAYTKMTVMLNECPKIRNAKEDPTWYTETDNWHGPFIVNELADEAVVHWIKNHSTEAKAVGITNSGGILEWWENAYEINRVLNEFLEGMGASSFSAQYKDERIAEARFLRAFNYFFMVKRYGGVPLILNSQKMSDPSSELFAKRNTEKEVYDFILSEMDDIVGKLPVRAQTELGRPSRGAAMALKARAALYAGSIAKYGTVQLGGLLGIDAALANDYFQKAYDACKQIRDWHEYSL